MKNENDSGPRRGVVNCLADNDFKSVYSLQNVKALNDNVVAFDKTILNENVL